MIYSLLRSLYLARFEFSQHIVLKSDWLSFGSFMSDSSDLRMFV